MSNVHLSEAQLQAYALDDLNDLQAAEHMVGCVHCQLQLRAYHTLYSHIREADAPLLDVSTTMLIPEQLPDTRFAEKRDARYVYSLLFGAIAIFITMLVMYWWAVAWMFSGIAIVAVVSGVLLVTGFVIMQLTTLYHTYQKKINALHAEQPAT